MDEQHILIQIGIYMSIVAALAIPVWGAAEIAGRLWSGTPHGGRVALVLATILGPLSGMALHGVGWLQIPGSPSPYWEMILASLSGLISTWGAAKAVNPTVNKLTKEKPS